MKMTAGASTSHRLQLLIATCIIRLFIYVQLCRTLGFITIHTSSITAMLKH